MVSLGLALALVIGLALGLMGGGGSILTVPIFVYVLHFAPKESIAMSLAVVGTVALFGAFSHWREGNMDFKVAFTFGGIAMVGTFLGTRVATLISGPAQLVVFAVVMLAASVTMFRKGSSDGDEKRADSDEPMRYGVLLAVGIAVGVLTGIVGVGGGFLIVPALVVLGKVPMKKAVGISLLIIAMNSAAGFAGYLDQVHVHWTFLAEFSTIAVIGILVGTQATKYISQDALKRAFAIFLVVMGAVILYKNSGVFLG